MKTAGVLYIKSVLLTLKEHTGSPPVFWWSQCCSNLYFSVLWFLCFFVLVLGIVSNLVHVPLDCPDFNVY